MNNQRQHLFIVGTSSSAVHLFTFVKEYDLFEVKGFAVDKQYRTDTVFCGLPVYTMDELPTVMDKTQDLLFVAVMWNHLNGDRRRLYNRLKQEGYLFANVVSPTARVRGTLSGDNIWIHDYAIVQDNALIGADTLIMAFSLIGSYVSLGAHCFCAAKSTIGGKCSVGEQCFIGIGATVFDERTVGNKCIVGAGVNVKRNLPDFSTCKLASDSYTVKQIDETEIESKLMFSKNIK